MSDFNRLLITSKKSKRFDLIRSCHYLFSCCERLPFCNECFKFISNGDFSSASFISLVANHTVIHDLYVSTFRVGRKEMLLLHKLASENRLENVHLVMFSQMLDGDNDETTRIIKRICAKYHWEPVVKKNHSKVLLFDTDDGKYVIETSSNLNENPKLEFYSFEQDPDVFEFYKKYIFDIAEGVELYAD